MAPHVPRTPRETFNFRETADCGDAAFSRVRAGDAARRPHPQIPWRCPRQPSLAAMWRRPAIISPVVAICKSERRWPRWPLSEAAMASLDDHFARSCNLLAEGVETTGRRPRWTPRPPREDQPPRSPRTPRERFLPALSANSA